MFRFRELKATFGVLALFCAAVCQSCAGPEPVLPESQTSSVQSAESRVEVTDASLQTGPQQPQNSWATPVTPFAAPVIMERRNFGAPIGDLSLQQQVASCVQGGYFFDRSTGQCDQGSQASDFDCSREGIVSGLMLSQHDREGFLNLFSDFGQLHGYMIDQCLVMGLGVRVYVLRLDENQMMVQRHLTLSR